MSEWLKNPVGEKHMQQGEQPLPGRAFWSRARAGLDPLPPGQGLGAEALVWLCPVPGAGARLVGVTVMVTGAVSLSCLSWPDDSARSPGAFTLSVPSLSSSPASLGQ